MKGLRQRDEFHLVNSRDYRPSAYKLQSAPSSLSNYELGRRGDPNELASDVVITSIKSLHKATPFRRESKRAGTLLSRARSDGRIKYLSASRIVSQQLREKVYAFVLALCVWKLYLTLQSHPPHMYVGIAQVIVIHSYHLNYSRLSSLEASGSTLLARYGRGNTRRHVFG